MHARLYYYFLHWILSPSNATTTPGCAPLFYRPLSLDWDPPSGRQMFLAVFCGQRQPSTFFLFLLSCPRFTSSPVSFTHLSFGPTALFPQHTLPTDCLVHPRCLPAPKRPEARRSSPTRHPYGDVGPSLATFAVPASVVLPPIPRVASAPPTSESQQLFL